MGEIEVFVEIVREGVTLPAYANPWDAGMDVCAACDTTIRPGVGNTPDDGEPLPVSTKGNRQGTYIIKKGDRIAQLVLAKVPRMRLSVVDSVKEIGGDRGGGFGSTGVK